MKKEKCLSTINLSYPDAKVRIGFGTYSDLRRLPRFRRAYPSTFLHKFMQRTLLIVKWTQSYVFYSKLNKEQA